MVVEAGVEIFHPASIFPQGCAQPNIYEVTFLSGLTWNDPLDPLVSLRGGVRLLTWSFVFLFLSLGFVTRTGSQNVVRKFARLSSDLEQGSSAVQAAQHVHHLVLNVEFQGHVVPVLPFPLTPRHTGRTSVRTCG